MNLIRRLLRGEVALPRAFWIFGALGTAAIIFLFYAWDMVQLVRVVVFGPPAHMFRQVYVSTTLQVIATGAFLLIVPIAIWRSAGNYEGRRSWAVLAKLGVIVFAVILLINSAARIYISSIVALGDNAKDIADPKRNSLNAPSSLKRDARFP
jgi:hypothetical protein